MVIKDVAKVEARTAPDGSVLRELLHPARDAAAGTGFSLAHAVVRPGASTLPHVLSHVEVYYVVDGRGVVHVGEEASAVRAGHAVHIPAGAVQWIENAGRTDLVFLCIVSPPWTEGCDRPAA